jgi:hypothetical protein
MKNTDIIVMALSAAQKAQIVKGCKTAQVVCQVVGAIATVAIGVIAISEQVKSGKE